MEMPIDINDLAGLSVKSRRGVVLAYHSWLDHQRKKEREKFKLKPREWRAGQGDYKTTRPKTKEKVKEKKQLVLEVFERPLGVNTAQIQRQLGWSWWKTQRYLERLESQGKLQHYKFGRKHYWVRDEGED